MSQLESDTIPQELTQVDTSPKQIWIMKIRKIRVNKNQS